MINAPGVRPTGLGFMALMKLARNWHNYTWIWTGAVSVPSFRSLRKHAVLEYHIGDPLDPQNAGWKEVVQNLRQS